MWKVLATGRGSLSRKGLLPSTLMEAMHLLPPGSCQQVLWFLSRLFSKTPPSRGWRGQVTRFRTFFLPHFLVSPGFCWDLHLPFHLTPQAILASGHFRGQIGPGQLGGGGVGCPLAEAKVRIRLKAKTHVLVGWFPQGPTSWPDSREEQWGL